MPTTNIVPPPVETASATAEVARWVVATTARLQEQGRGWLDALAPDGIFVPGEHYPEADVWDPETHAQWFFHAHEEGGGFPGEVGHFHTFLGQAGMRPGTMPLVLPEMALAGSPIADPAAAAGTHRSRRDRGVFSHLIGISIDAAGIPLGLFTTNRWVTGETWYRGADVVRMLDRFDFTGAGPHPLIDAWLTALFRLLRQDLIALIEERDRVVMDWRQRRAQHRHVFDDRRLVVPSAVGVDFLTLLARHGGV
jgi:hypothetical protein